MILKKYYLNFWGDSVLNIIQEYTDTKWLIQMGKNNMYLQNQLAEQKEKEKQELLKKKDGMTGDQRLVKKQLEQTGMTNLFKDSEKYYQEKAEAEQYDNSFGDDNDEDDVDNDGIDNDDGNDEDDNGYGGDYGDDGGGEYDEN